MGQSQTIRASRLASPNNNSESYILRSCLYSSKCTCSLAYVREFGFLTAAELFLPFSNDETEVRRRVLGYTVVSGKAMDWWPPWAMLVSETSQSPSLLARKTHNGFPFVSFSWTPSNFSAWRYEQTSCNRTRAFLSTHSVFFCVSAC